MNQARRLPEAVVVEWGGVHHTPRTGGQLLDLFGEIDDYFDAGVVLHERDCVFDVGANIGAFAISVARRCRGNVSLHCFEPAPVPNAALRANARANPWLRRADVHVSDLALGAPETGGAPARLYYFSRFPCDSTLDIAQKRAEFRQFFAYQADQIRKTIALRLGSVAGRVAAWARLLFIAFMRTRLAERLADLYTGVQHVTISEDSLGNYVRRENVSRIDLLKVDVEGHEVSVLRGLDEPSWARIHQVVVETDGRRAPMAELVYLLRRSGFSRVRISRTKAAAARGLDNRIVTASRT